MKYIFSTSNSKKSFRKPLLSLMTGFTILALFFALSSCGFRLRGYFSLPPEFQCLKILPDQPFEPFQRILRQTLKMNNVEILDPCLENPPCPYATLIICNQQFTERVIAYGKDVQANRSILQFSLTFQVQDKNGCDLIPSNTIKVERELSIIPNAILSTDNERIRLHNDLYLDAVTQMMRQLSVMAYENSCH